MLSRFSSVWFIATLWTVAGQAPLSVEFSKQEYQSGLAFPPPFGKALKNPDWEPSILLGTLGLWHTTRAAHQDLMESFIKYTNVHDAKPWESHW